MLIRSLALATLAFVSFGGMALAADGYPPFYGYSGYFGAPRTYYSGTDLRSATSYSEGLPGFGTRTYKEGGPFYALRPARERTFAPAHAKRRRTVLRSRG